MGRRCKLDPRLKAPSFKILIVKKDQQCSFSLNLIFRALRHYTLEATGDYDTFGTTAVEKARERAQREADARDGGREAAIPGPIHADLIAPVSVRRGCGLNTSDDGDHHRRAC